MRNSTKKYLIGEIPNVVVAALVIAVFGIAGCAPSLSVARASLFDINYNSTDSADSRAHAHANTHNEAHHTHTQNHATTKKTKVAEED